MDSSPRNLFAWYGELSTLKKILYPLGLLVVVGGITVGLIFLLSGPGATGQLVPDGVEVVDAELAPAVQLTSGEGNDSHPTASPDGLTIAFASDRGGNSDIYSIPAEGGELQQLTHETSDEVAPDFSADSSSIAYASDATGRGFDIYVMDARGGGEQRLTYAEGDEIDPRWSPIQFQGATTFYRILYRDEDGFATIREDGSDRLKPDLPKEAVAGRFSPHGLGYIAQHETAEGTSIVTSGLEGIINLEGVHGLQPVLSPNMTGLLFIGSINGNHRVYYYEPGRERLLRLNKLTEPGELTWKPDGSGFYYTDLVDGYFKLFYQPLPLPLADVSNLWQYASLTAAEVDTLERNSFLYGRGVWDSFAALYQAEYPGDSLYADHYTRPTYITADAVLELLDYYFDFLLTGAETDSLRLALDNFYFALASRLRDEIHTLEESSSYARANPDSLLVAQLGGVEAYNTLIEHLRFLADYIEAGSELLISSQSLRAEIPNPEAFRAADTIRRGTGLVPIISREGFSYSAEQFAVSNRYQEAGAQAVAFQRGRLWSSLVKFDLTDRDQALEVALLTWLLRSGELRSTWSRIDGFFAYHYGAPDNFDIDTLDNLLNQAWGADVTLAELADPEGLERFMAAAAELQAEITKNDEEEPPTFALFAERLHPLDDYLESLHSPAVGGGGAERQTALLLDLAAANGSDSAWNQLIEVQGEGGYTGYKGSLSAVKTDLRRNDDTLFYGWMRALRPWMATILPDFPEDGGEEETEVAPDEEGTRIANLLALRSSYAFCGALTARLAEATSSSGTLPFNPALPPAPGEQPALPLPQVWVEPSPELFERLAVLVNEQYKALRDSALFPEFVSFGGDTSYQFAVDEADERVTAEELMAESVTPESAVAFSGTRVEDIYRDIYNLLTRLGTISRQQVSGIPLSEDDRYFLITFGNLASELTDNCNVSGSPARLVSYYGSGLWLNAAIGKPEELLRLVTLPDGSRQIVVGAAYGYYEQKLPAALSAEEWLTQSVSPPPRPGWASVFEPVQVEDSPTDEE